MSFNDGRGQEPGIDLGAPFGFPLRLSYSALFVPVLFALSGGLPRSAMEAVLTAADIAVLFFSVYVHELGHAFAARHYRRGPIDITLTGLGGYTRMARPSPTPRAGLLVSLAGPLVGMALGILSFVGLFLFASTPLGPVLYQLVYVNIVWSLFNLVPMYPLDGGQVLLYFLLERTGRSTALRATGWVSVVMVALVALAAFSAGYRMTAIIAVWTLSSSVRLLSA